MGRGLSSASKSSGQILVLLLRSAHEPAAVHPGGKAITAIQCRGLASSPPLTSLGGNPLIASSSATSLWRRRRPLERTMMMSASKTKGAVAEVVEGERGGKGSKSSAPPSPSRHRVNGKAAPVEEVIGIDNSGIVGEHHSHLPHTGRSVRARDSPALMFLEQAKKVWKFTDKDSKMTQETVWEQCNIADGIKEVKEVDRTFRGFGVETPVKDHDIQILTSNYTARALATGLRDREETLQICARLLADGNIEQLRAVLHPYEEGHIMRGRKKKWSLDLSNGINQRHLNMLRKYLHRMPRQITRPVSVRASVVIPLCNVDGVASILFERRSANVRSFKNQVCFPGGMVDTNMDMNVIETSLREMEEEIGVPAHEVDVLGVMRCDWSEVAKITGIGVTPVVCFVGELARIKLQPNPDEVSECFTIPLYSLLDKAHWIKSDGDSSVVFGGGPHIIWGLTAYILDLFLTDVVLRYQVEDYRPNHCVVKK